MDTVQSAIEAANRKVVGRRASRGRVPYGYRVVDGIYRLEATEQRALLLAVSLRSAGHSMPRIARELSERGYRTRFGSEWGRATIHHLLKAVSLPANTRRPSARRTGPDGSEQIAS